MKKYKVTFYFTNLDNSLYTDYQASTSMDIESDDYSHVYLLAERMQKVFDADDFRIYEQ